VVEGKREKFSLNVKTCLLASFIKMNSNDFLPSDEFASHDPIMMLNGKEIQRES
jgi:hypothetical protein